MVVGYQYLDDGNGAQYIFYSSRVLLPSLLPVVPTNRICSGKWDQILFLRNDQQRLVYVIITIIIIITCDPNWPLFQYIYGFWRDAGLWWRIIRSWLSESSSSDISIWHRSTTFLISITSTQKKTSTKKNDFEWTYITMEFICLVEYQWMNWSKLGLWSCRMDCRLTCRVSGEWAFFLSATRYFALLQKLYNPHTEMMAKVIFLSHHSDYTNDTIECDMSLTTDVGLQQWHEYMKRNPNYNDPRTILIIIIIYVYHHHCPQTMMNDDACWVGIFHIHVHRGCYLELVSHH